LVFPFLILFTRRYSCGYLLGLFAVLVTLRLLVWLDKGDVHLLAYWTIFGRMDQFLAGMVAGLLGKRLSTSANQRVHLAAGLLGMAGVVTIVSVYMSFNRAGGYIGIGDRNFFWVVLPAIEAVCYSLIVAGYLLAPQFPVLAKGWISKAFAYFGQISYSMYLTHFLVYAVVVKYILQWIPPASVGGWQSAVTVFALTAFPAVVAVSAMTYAFIERPFLELNRSRSRSGDAEVTPILTSRAA
jgi:peptidoglycan/LPS O-acetylase OafA/YrhL